MDPLDHNLKLLTQGQTHRVWSVIVTLFGDLAQAEGDEISALALTQIMQRVGFKPEAIRVALHRLRKDGWIETRRDGRASIYRLSAQGRQQSAWASPRIYGGPPDEPTAWHVLVGPADALDPYVVEQGYVPLSAQAVLGQGPAPDNLPGLFALTGDAVQMPAWLHDQICPQDLRRAAHDLHARLRAMQPITPNDPIEMAALRVLIVHSWRRIRLRYGDLPAMLFPPDWPGPACRDLVAQRLAAIPRPPLDAIETAARTGSKRGAK